MTATTIPRTPQPNNINNPLTNTNPSDKTPSQTPETLQINPEPTPNKPQTTPNPTPNKLQTKSGNYQKSLRRISLHPTLTPYRRRVYRALLSIPPGRWTTYSALAKYLDSSARAVGTAMRTNPFAPEVPCHRVLAADRTLGGYMGSGPASGSKNLLRKREMLEGEGVVFGIGKGGVPVAEGECFDEFYVSV